MDKILRKELIQFFEEDGGQGWFSQKKLRTEKRNEDNSVCIDLTKDDYEMREDQADYNEEYNGMDISSLSSEKGTRDYLRILEKNVQNMSITVVKEGEIP